MRERLTDKALVKLFKQFNDIQFTERNIGSHQEAKVRSRSNLGNVIGHIQHYGRSIQVSCVEDKMGQYIVLAYIEGNIMGMEDLTSDLSKRIINSRFQVEDDKIIVNVLCPIHDDNISHNNIVHALWELWDMGTVIYYNQHGTLPQYN